tara:strand:+ start:719 stop:1684 length:966 start_codon:yes stop_codon:yes gene_type:complete
VKYSLITDSEQFLCNPGDVLIGKGIQYLLDSYERQNNNIPTFSYCKIFDNNSVSWELCKYSDVVVLCGTPQFTQDSIPEWFSSAFYSKIRELKTLGVKVINMMVGGCYQTQNYKSDAISELLNQKNFILSNFGLWDGIISRDFITNEVIIQSGLKSFHMADSVSWARRFYGVEKQNPAYDVFTITAIGDIDRQLEIFKRIEATTSLPFKYLVHHYDDYVKLKDRVENLVLISTAKSLVQFYSMAKCVYSLRVHGSVIASSFGCDLLHVAVDSRSNILEYLGVKVISLDDFLDGSNNYPSYVNVDAILKGDEKRFIEWYEKI